MWLCLQLRGSGNATHAPQLLLEEHCEKQKPVHHAFVDLEKAFDWVPDKVIWYALRKHGVRELINWACILYDKPNSRVLTPLGTSILFPISVGVLQGLALSRPCDGRHNPRIAKCRALDFADDVMPALTGLIWNGKYARGAKG